MQELVELMRPLLGERAEAEVFRFFTSDIRRDAKDLADRCREACKEVGLDYDEFVIA